MSMLPPLKSSQEREGKTTKEPKRYKCSEAECDRAFTRPQALKAHELSHTGEKPHVCSLSDCGRSYRRPGELARHLREDHNKERPFVCDGTGNFPGICSCGKQFRRKALLNKHLAMATSDKIPSFNSSTLPILSAKRMLSTESERVDQVGGQSIDDVERSFAKKLCLDTVTNKQETPETKPHAYGDSSTIAGPAYKQVIGAQEKSALLQMHRSAAGTTRFSPRMNGVMSAIRLPEDVHSLSSPSLENQSQELQALGSAVADLQAIDHFRPTAELDGQEEPQGCFRCCTTRCQFAEYSVDRVLDHYSFRRSSNYADLESETKSMILVCLHQRCYERRVSWSALVHHQLESHLQDFLDKSGMTAVELARIKRTFSLDLTGLTLPGDPEVSVKGIIDNILNSTRLTTESLTREGIEIDLEAFYSKLASRTRRVRYSDRSDLGTKVKRLVWEVLEEFRQEGIRLRDERVAAYETYWKRHREGPLRPTEPLPHGDHFSSWVDSIDGPQTSRAYELITRTERTMKLLHDDEFLDLDDRRKLSMQWLEESLNSIIAAREFTPSLHSGETDQSFEAIPFYSDNIVPHSTQQFMKAH
ncbi:hypothetical protein PV08_01092 [Exophiala spinifera]|uniref:C2H2-type domain-containing protein n=1 Tax=Exophiala spinifera TaxID=91928 RepID=A0A0D2A704_9EURO|nr:uncharacterized protein PV08_01092 [Exophiala spinifera]KIW20517.1 hypothetical protein PV08_01092 [Exophiala spinifera]